METWNTDKPVLYERQEVKMQPFYWILTFEALFFLLALGLGLVALPFYLVQFSTVWAVICFIAGLPLGGYLIWAAVRAGRQRIWENDHLDRYRLFEDGFEFEQYDKKLKSKKSAFVPFSKVEEAVGSKFIAKYHYAYRKSGFFEKQPYAHIFPVLFFIYREAGERKLARIYFKDDHSINQWLKETGKNGIPIRICIHPLDILPDEQLLEVYGKEREEWPLSDFGDEDAANKSADGAVDPSGGIGQQGSMVETDEGAGGRGDARHMEGPGRYTGAQGTHHQARGWTGVGRPADFHLRFEQLATAASREQANRQREVKLKEAKTKAAIPFWLPYILLALGLALLYGAADRGIISTGNWWIGLAVYLPAYAGSVYLLRKATIWKALLLILLSFVILFVTMMFVTETGAKETEVFFESLLTAYFVSVLLSIVLYPVLLILRKKRPLKHHDNPS
ncbi:Uncharacterised protein [Chlamydia abortus]|uniref:Uncharacterized protein n=1 Tax=Paenibacillus residui TaxID=629724 RepID=A0ABW3D8K1_9BACL|nr:Uncharacterised protein [Chlamydia abortus]